jgi:uncharacterized membrane protein HdeD (DUF308 family)
MESLARVRAGVVAIVIGLFAIVIGLLSSGGGGSTTSSQGLGWPTIVGIVLIVGGAAVLALGLRNRRQEQREMDSLRAAEHRDTSDDRPL